jgi:hypothetical protein
MIPPSTCERPMTRSALIISTMVLAGAVGCGGRESGMNAGTSSGSSGASSGLDASDGGAADVGPDAPALPEYHRVDDSQCAVPRPAGGCKLMSADGGPDGPCATDLECQDSGVGGRCASGLRGCTCTYDECQTDSDCGAGMLCVCHDSAYSAGAGNTCMLGNCRVDTDCGPGGYCSPRRLALHAHASRLAFASRVGWNVIGSIGSRPACPRTAPSASLRFGGKSCENRPRPISGHCGEGTVNETSISWNPLYPLTVVEYPAVYSYQPPTVAGGWPPAPFMATFAIRTLRRAPVVMVESAEYRNGLDATVHLRWAWDGLLLSERLVRARPVVEAREFGNQMSEVVLSEDEDVVEKLAS